MLLLLAAQVHAETLSVGADKTYTRVSDAVLASQPGDVIEIDPGEYVDDWVVFPHGDLEIRSSSPTERPVLRVTQDISNRKGIFVIPVGAGPVQVDGLHFEGARIPESDGGNGAGIRMQGTALTVNDCVFTQNQDGLLAGGSPDFSVTITNSVFDHNAQQSYGYEHNVYIGSDQCESFVFEGNASFGTKSGHQLKSRCRNNYIRYNFLGDQADGQASYTIDLPEGGYSEVVGNLIQQGPNAENSSTIVSYGAESDNPEMVLLLAHNTFVNDRDNTPNFVRTKGATQVVMRNNLFIGTGTPLESDSGEIDRVGDLQVEAGSELMDRSAYDYRLSPSATAVDAGSPIEASLSFLIPEREYISGGTQARWDDGAPDVGAYGIGEEPQDTGDSGDSGDPSDTGPDTGAPADTPEGCGCATPASGSAAWLLILGFIPLLRRRARPVATSSPK